jgi:hypothetical protein
LGWGWMQRGDAGKTEGEPPAKGGGKGGKELDRKAVSQAHRAEIADKLIGLLNNAPKDASAEQILKTAQIVSQHEFENLSEEEQAKCKPVKIVVPNTVEKLGIKIAKIVVTLGDPESAKVQEAVALSFELLRAAGITKVGKIEVPSAKHEAAEAPNGKKVASVAAAKAEESKAS